MDLAAEVDRVRAGQLRINEMMRSGEVKARVHLALGQEAITVAVSAAMQDGDQLVLTHRNLHFHLARGMTVEEAVSGFNGPLGSMNLMCPERGCVYTSSILGNGLPVACGLALANKVAGNDAVVWAITADGAIEEGAFWEALHFAKTHALRVVFVVIDDDRSMSSTKAERRCEIDLRGLCLSLGICHSCYGRIVEDVDMLASDDFLGGLGKCLRKPAKPWAVELRCQTLNPHCGPVEAS